MKKYAGVKPMDEIKKAVIAKGWPWNQMLYDDGSDWLTFGFEYKGRRFDVCFRPFGGKFIIDTPKGLVTEESKEYDRTAWYVALMDFIYLPLEKKKGTK